jgi:hypothetical protein
MIASTAGETNQSESRNRRKFFSVKSAGFSNTDYDQDELSEFFLSSYAGVAEDTLCSWIVQDDGV